MNKKVLAYFLFAFFLFVLLLPNVVWVVTSASGERAPWMALFIGVLVVFGVYALLGWAHLVVIFLSGPFFLVPFEVFYIFHYGRPSDALLFGVISESPPAEAIAFLGFGLTLLSIAYLVFSPLLIVTSYRLCKGIGLSWRGSTRYFFIAMMVLVVVWICVLEALSEENDGRMHLQSGEGVERVRYPFILDLEDSYPAGLIVRLQTFFKEREILAEMKRQRQFFKFNAYSAHDPAQREIYVLVIGETGRPDRLGLNGYARNTTPRLSKIGGVVSFHNMVSSWAWTRMAVPVLVSRKKPDDHRDYFAEPGLVTVFKEAGFKTYWVSTQSPFGMQDSSISVFAREADEVRFMNPADYMLPGEHDGVMLQELDRILAEGEEKQLIVLHTLGGHFNYADRYPKRFDVFRPSLKGVMASLRDRHQKERMSNSYDNSVLYMDYFLSSVLDRLRQASAVSAAFYVADHGENLFDGNCDKSGHGENTEYDYRVSALWWASSKYRQAYPLALRRALQRVDAPLGSYNVFHSFLDMAGVKYSQQDLSKSLFSSAWRPHLRPTQSYLDFDRSGRDAVCKTLIAGGE
ncbi:phosphoethanolamine transferase [Pseudomonas knackmussii]|uniref:phosphoethanolamine transferase n=1 Tax=Pseudomonas knackmussii TaxID=65741 RepID=UPI0013633063|nr:phosphoethanolamine transferase [Pseudomonas knackmussii]